MSEMYAGDKIVTTKNFIAGEGWKGYVYPSNNDEAKYYAIVFDEPEKLDKKLLEIKPEEGEPQLQLHYLYGEIEDKAGYYLEKKEFLRKQVYKDQDKQKEMFVNLLRQNRFLEFQKIPSRIKNLESIIKNDFQSIDYKRNEILELEDQIKRVQEQTEELKENQKEKEIPIDDLIFIYDKLLKHKKIKKIEIIKRSTGFYLLVFTNDLVYTHKKDDISGEEAVAPFTLGSYVLSIPLDPDYEIRAFNYTKTYMRGVNHHPCVDEYGHICTGATIRNILKEAHRNSDFLNIVFTLIHFLEKPDYGEPYLDARYFQFAQKITTAPPTDLEKYLSSSFYRSVNWDTEAYEEQLVLAELD